MLYAHKIVKEGGFEALDKEIKLRNFLKLDIYTPIEEAKKFHEMISQNCYQSMLSAFMFTLRDAFGFGEKRLKRLKREFDKNISNLFDLTWYGDHFVRFEDYAKVLNEECNMDFDIARIEVLQDLQDEQDTRFGALRLKTACKELREHGFEDAAEWLENKAS